MMKCARLRKVPSLKVDISYVVPPTDEQLFKIKEFIKDKCHADELDVSLKEDKNLLGGFVIRAGHEEYDWSMRGRLQQIENKMKENVAAVSSMDDIITILKTEIDESAFDKSKEKSVMLHGSATELLTSRVSTMQCTVRL